MPEALIQQNQIVPNTSPNFTQVALTTALNASVIGSNQVRRGILFSNPSSTVTIYLAPAGSAIAAGQGIPVLPGATFPLFSNGNVQVNCAWQAIATGNVNLGILEFV